MSYILIQKLSWTKNIFNIDAKNDANSASLDCIRLAGKDIFVDHKHWSSETLLEDINHLILSIFNSSLYSTKLLYINDIVSGPIVVLKFNSFFLPRPEYDWLYFIFFYLSDRMGFEPMVLFHSTPVFKTGALNHSTTYLFETIILKKQLKDFTTVEIVNALQTGVAIKTQQKILQNGANNVVIFNTKPQPAFNKQFDLLIENFGRRPWTFARIVLQTPQVPAMVRHWAILRFCWRTRESHRRSFWYSRNGIWSIVGFNMRFSFFHRLTFPFV